MAIQSHATKIRFWGKLLCSHQDLYVVEMKAPLEDTYQPIEGEEQRGEGVNSCIYWVSHDLLGEWVKLPDVRGESIVAARKIKRVLSGHLEADVEAYPFFAGKECHLIRAQIARITAATLLAPKGLFKESENSTQCLSLFCRS